MEYFISLKQYKKAIKDLNGLSVEKLEHNKKDSSYNYNYYKITINSIHYKLLGCSDDDTETEWYWVNGNCLLLIGYSYINEHREKIDSSMQ